MILKAKWFFNQSHKIKNILICPDKFKFSMTALEVASIIQQNLPNTVNSTIIELADGGEGSINAISRKVKGQWISCQVHDPLFRKIQA